MPGMGIPQCIEKPIHAFLGKCGKGMGEVGIISVTMLLCLEQKDDLRSKKGNIELVPEEDLVCIEVDEGISPEHPSHPHWIGLVQEDFQVRLLSIHGMGLEFVDRKLQVLAMPF